MLDYVGHGQSTETAIGVAHPGSAVGLASDVLREGHRGWRSSAGARCIEDQQDPEVDGRRPVVDPAGELAGFGVTARARDELRASLKLPCSGGTPSGVGAGQHAAMAVGRGAFPMAQGRYCKDRRWLI